MIRFRRIRQGFTLIELLVVVAIIALLISILLPALANAREQTKRGICGQNLKGLTNACKTYAFDNRDWWPTVTTFRGLPSNYGAMYKAMGGVTGLPRDESSENVDSPKGKDVSPSRALWVLVQNGQLTPKNLICPSTEDIVDETLDVSSFYDFKGYGYLSYGYQIPFFERFNSCRPRENVDPRMVLLADKNPSFVRSTEEAVQSASPPPNIVAAFNSQYDIEAQPQYFQSCPPNISRDSAFDELKILNSENHGGKGQGEGQNVARADGSVGFEKTVLAGVDGDNIYTTILRSTGAFDQRLLCGGPLGTNAYAVPGDKAFGADKDSSTDTALFP